MGNIKFVKTEDFSTGLFSNEVNDIFHSKTGALTEAYEKFFYPIKAFIQNKKRLNILDICYGIGYNSKVILSNLKNIEINIDAFEYNEDYVNISPFIKDEISDVNLRSFILSQVIKSYNPPVEKWIKIFEDYIKPNFDFFDSSTSFFDDLTYKMPYKSILLNSNNLNLHNIYYSYLSISYTDILDSNKFKQSSINFYIGDARKKLQLSNKEYDVVFLDAFSSQKDPTLWTIDFLTLIKSKMNNDSILVTYSKSSPFRSALKQLGFTVGKTFINDLDMGTIASLNSDYIINKLTDYDNSLLDTRSGITYKDPDFALSGIEILKQREIEQKNSNLMSHTQFLKNFSR